MSLLVRVDDDLELRPPELRPARRLRLRLRPVLLSSQNPIIFFKVAPYWPRHRLIWGFTQRPAWWFNCSDWAETSAIGSQHIGAPKLAMGPRASNRFRRCSVSAVSGGGTALAQEPYKVCRSHPWTRRSRRRCRLLACGWEAEQRQRRYGEQRGAARALRFVWRLAVA